jgi:hypothetical protein
MLRTYSTGRNPLLNRRLRQDVFHHFHIIRRPNQPFVEAVVEEGERLAVEAEKM